jgi:hypothetical protein
MGVTAFDGPIITYPQNPLGVWPAGYDSQSAPCAFLHGPGIADARGFFAYQPGSGVSSTYYFWSTTSQVVLIDQVPATAATNNIAASQSPGAGAITLVSTTGAGVTAGVSITNATTGAAVTGLLALDGAMGSVGYAADATAQAWDPTKALSRCVTITSGSSDTGINFTVHGYDIYGYPMTQTLAGSGGAPGAVTTTKAFKYIASVTHTGSVAGTVTVGTADIFGFPWQVLRQPYVNIWWGNPQDEFAGGTTAAQTVLEIPVNLANLANAQVYQVDAPFDGTLVAANFRVTVAATTAAKAATLTAQANGTSVTGGVIALTSANATPVGAKVAGSAITGANTFTAGQTVGVVVSAVTTFIEGAGVIELTVQNSDATGGTFTAAVTTSPSTASLGDVRGTIATPSASDGTKRLTVFITLPPAQVSAYNGAASVCGVAQV